MTNSKYNCTETTSMLKQRAETQHWDCPEKNVTKTQVVKLQKIARSKIEAIGDFATGLAHELNQPMTFINSVFDYLNMKIDKQELDEVRAKKLISTAKQEIKRVSGILNNLYEFGEGKVGTMTRVSMIGVVEELLEIIEERMLNFAVEVSYSIPEDLPDLLANKAQIKQGLMYLFENSLEALDVSPGDSKQISLRAELSEDGRFIILRFSNNGLTIPNRDLDRIFEPFYTTKKGLQNSGLGLSILYSLTRNHNGTIRTLPNITDGVIFELMLPVFGRG